MQMGMEMEMEMGIPVGVALTVQKKMETPRCNCNFWLPRKNRFCANNPLKDSLFCGNHNPKSEEQRIPCPIDPSHSVLQENLEAHIKKCPFLKQAESLRLQPFYKKGINGGIDEEYQEEEEEPILGNNEIIAFSIKSGFGSSDIVTSDMKRNAVYKRTVPEFSELIRKIESVHPLICSGLRDSYKKPEACGLWMNKEVDRKLPFQEKHVLQQASILGNLEEFGVLENPIKNVASTCLGEQLDRNGSSEYDNGVPAIVEFGAGRGYLTQMLADCYGIKKVFLIERKSCKLKADRSLRQKESLILERLRIDIEDLDLNAVESLKGIPYLATGKHLCGPATDLTLRCCLPENFNQEKTALSSGSCTLKGLAIATCCHHLCQWKHYINKSSITNMGFTKDDFHAITWFTSWAVDADHGSNLSDMVDRGFSLNSISEKKDCGVDVCGVEEIVRSIPAVERAVLGLMCKEIIDMGRHMWLKERGLEAQLVKYVPSNISPENHLLIAKNTNHL